MRRFTRFLLPLAFALAFALPPLLVGGVGIGRAMLASLAKAPDLSTAPPAHDPSKPTAVVLAGNGNTESSDLLGPYETLATSAGSTSLGSQLRRLRRHAGLSQEILAERAGADRPRV